MGFILCAVTGRERVVLLLFLLRWLTPQTNERLILMGMHTGLVSLSLVDAPLLGPPHTHLATAHPPAASGGTGGIRLLRTYFLGDVTSRNVRAFLASTPLSSLVHACVHATASLFPSTSRTNTNDIAGARRLLSGAAAASLLLPGRRLFARPALGRQHGRMGARVRTTDVKGEKKVPIDA